MKKFLFILLVSSLAFSVQSQAQRATAMSLAAGDTVTNTGTAAKVLPVITTGYSGVAITAIVTKISGTNGGTVGIYGSNDGTNYDLIGSNYTVTTASSQSKTFYITAPLPTYIKVLETGTGTMSSVLSVQYVFRKTATQ